MNDQHFMSMLPSDAVCNRRFAHSRSDISRLPVQYSSHARFPLPVLVDTLAYYITAS
jgi:hypothetical protein